MPSRSPIRHWHDGSGVDTGLRHGDLVSARQQLAPAAIDDAALAPLRTLAVALADGTDWSRADDHQLIDQLAAALARGRLRTGAAAAPKLSRLVPTVAPAPAPAPPPPAASSPRPSAPVAAPPPAETTFGSELDVAAMVAVLQQAAQDGVPFCEECARAAAEAAA